MSDDPTTPPVFDSQRARWRKSSFSGTGECVELAAWHGRIALRNSNDPGGGTLLLGRDEVSALLAGMKAGEFDDLT